METVSLKMEKNILKDMDNAIKFHRYSTRTEFIRDAIRDKLSDLEKEDLIKKLASFKGILKGKAKMNEKEAAEKAFVDIAKNAGINLD